MLKIEPLSASAFSPFGDVIGVNEARRHFTINAGYAERYHDLAHIQVARGGGYPIISIFRAQPRQFPLTMSALERHPLGSQAFFPLAAQPFLVVVALGGEAPELSSIRCFMASPGQGVNYAPGIWHHALIALDTPSDFLVIDRGGADTDANCDEFSLLHCHLTIQYPQQDPHEP
ncbi:MAG: ureidoglycolate lyase [Rhodoferax sp.]|nr:ureidoglycolate lyase [Rhodoferax sp.]